MPLARASLRTFFASSVRPSWRYDRAIRKKTVRVETHVLKPVLEGFLKLPCVAVQVAQVAPWARVSRIGLLEEFPGLRGLINVADVQVIVPLDIEPFPFAGAIAQLEGLGVVAVARLFFAKIVINLGEPPIGEGEIGVEFDGALGTCTLLVARISGNLDTELRMSSEGKLSPHCRLKNS